MGHDAPSRTQPIISPRLRPITELTGDDFLHAWWAIIECHLAFWKKGIYHRDIGLSNLMYYSDEKGRIVGVLNDFDSASDRETCAIRTGSMPFMATPLVEKELQTRGTKTAGAAPHSYEHDAEFFLRVLIWTVLNYDSGERGDLSPTCFWMGIDPSMCRFMKTGFLSGRQWNESSVGAGHEQSMRVVDSCANALRAHTRSRIEQTPPPGVLPVDVAFETLLSTPAGPFLRNCSGTNPTL